MKRFSAFLAIGFGCVAIVAAQTTTPQTSSPQSSASKSDQTITLTGCLQRGDHAGAVGTTGTAGTPPAAGASRSQSQAGNSAQFILTNAKSGSSSDTSRSAAGTTGAPTSAGAAGTAATSSAAAHPSATSGSTYVLEGSQSELASNAGKRVEVTGTIDSMSSSSPSSATSAAGSPSASASASQKFHVSSVKVIGSDCSSDQ